jgi:hypothetical protein
MIQREKGREHLRKISWDRRVPDPTAKQPPPPASGGGGRGGAAAGHWGLFIYLLPFFKKRHQKVNEMGGDG